MEVQRFSGLNSREAMRKVKAAFGDDALILGNRSTDMGIEILAALEPAAGFAPGPDLPGREPARPTALPAATELSRNDGRGTDASAGLEEKLMAEVREVKAMLTSSTARMQSTDSPRGLLRSLLMGAGFSEELAAELVMQLPARLDCQPLKIPETTAWLRDQLALRFPSPVDGTALVDAGGIFALVGPTGSGKTTTTAKIAAQYVMRHGSDDVALISTDYYRVGAHEQLREYANLLNVTFRALQPGQSLARVLEGLKRKKLVLIDTVGLSQRDQRVLETFSELQSVGAKVDFLLLLSGSSHAQTLEEVINCYRHSAQSVGGAIERCIITKLDETCSPALLVDKLLRHSLTPLFSSAGQRVPEDLEAPDIGAVMTPVLSELLSDSEAPRGEPLARSPDWTRGLLSRGRQIAVSLRMLRDTVPGFERLESLWDISLLNSTWQAARIAKLREDRPTDPAAGGVLLWGGDGAVKGSEFYCPHLVVNDRFKASAVGCLQQPYWEGNSVRFADLESDLGVHTHVLSDIPDANTLEALIEAGRCWLAPVHRIKHVGVEDATLPVARVLDNGATAGEHAFSYRGQPAVIKFRKKPVTFSARGDQPSRCRFSGVAWSGSIFCASTGKQLGARYWVSSGEQNLEQKLLGQVQLAALPALTRHAREALLGMPGFQDSEELRLLVASGMAGTALRLEQEEDPLGAELREQVLAVLGTKRACNGKNLIEGLAYLFIARELLVPGRLN